MFFPGNITARCLVFLQLIKQAKKEAKLIIFNHLIRRRPIFHFLVSLSELYFFLNDISGIKIKASIQYEKKLSVHKSQGSGIPFFFMPFHILHYNLRSLGNWRFEPILETVFGGSHGGWLIVWFSELYFLGFQPVLFLPRF